MSQEAYINSPQDIGKSKRFCDGSQSVAFAKPMVVSENHPPKLTPGETHFDQDCEKILCEDLPMSDPFKGAKFYVRDCYRQYYEYIMQSLEGEFDQISLTGTPGIGKSIFSIYFFQRYRREFPKATIVTASFTIYRKLEQCIRFGPDDLLGEKFFDIRGLEADIYLYDGPPEMDPGVGKKMVSFTCPNYDWFNVMRKTPYHARMHLPFWSLEELLEAMSFYKLGCIMKPSMSVIPFSGVRRASVLLHTFISFRRLKFFWAHTFTK